MKIEINDIKKSLNQSFPDSRTRITIDLIIEKLEEFEERLNAIEESIAFVNKDNYRNL